MSEDRPDLPYEKAAEEGAKTLGKSFDLVNKASPAIADIYYWMIGNRIAEQRNRNADKYARETRRIFEERDIKEKRAIPEDLASSLLEAAMRDPRNELQSLYAALTVNAFDPAFHDDVRPEFVETVRRWQPIDVRVMQFAFSQPREKAQFNHRALIAVLGTERSNAIAVSLDHLTKLGCLLVPAMPSYTITPYGMEIMRAVSTELEAPKPTPE